MPNILILEDDPLFLSQLLRAMRREFQDIRALGARTIEEGQILLSEYEADYLIVGTRFEDGNGLDFLCDAMTTHPNTLAIVLSEEDDYHYRTEAEKLDIVRFLKKPVSAVSIAKLLQRAIESRRMEENLQDDQFQASLSCLSSIDIIQLKCQARATQVLKFELSGGQVGKLHFCKGEIIHAETGEEEGIPAFQDIVAWKGGRVCEAAEPIKAEPTIREDWQSLLLDAVKQIDEEKENLKVA